MLFECEDCCEIQLKQGERIKGNHRVLIPTLLWKQIKQWLNVTNLVIQGFSSGTIFLHGSTFCVWCVKNVVTDCKEQYELQIRVIIAQNIDHLYMVLVFLSFVLQWSLK